METTISSIKTFVLAGKSIFTLHNKETNKRFTYKVTCSVDKDGKPKDLWFVSVLVGSDNEGDYQYAGIITKTGFRITAKSRFTKDTISVKGFAWLWSCISSSIELPEKVEFFHAGRCGRCGRLLTTPDSVESGYGPVCRELI